jgi:hypothetical protein
VINETNQEQIGVSKRSLVFDEPSSFTHANTIRRCCRLPGLYNIKPGVEEACGYELRCAGA